MYNNMALGRHSSSLVKESAKVARHMAETISGIRVVSMASFLWFLHTIHLAPVLLLLLLLLLTLVWLPCVSRGYDTKSHKKGLCRGFHLCPMMCVYMWGVARGSAP